MEPDQPREEEEELPDCGVNDEDSGQPANILISDVIAAIQNTDPSFEAAVQQCGPEMYGGANVLPGNPGPPMQAQNVALQPRRRNAHVRIIEQPASKSLRFRYECEGRCAGAIPGVHSTPENKTYPTIEIVGYKGRAVVVVSCVTKDPPYRPHPHNLVGREVCKKGVCTVEINSESMCVSFSNLGIQCVRKRDINEALRVREEIRVDPFKTGFSHRSQPSSIDLNAVRLCFQVFLEDPEKGKFTIPLAPIVSDIIYDKKAMSDLVICKMSHCSAPAAGGQEIIILCEKVAKEDISVRFYEEKDGQLVWEALGEFQQANVHKQVAITFRSPRYNEYLKIDQPVKVYIQLKRPSDGATSAPLPFELKPLDSGRTGILSRRRETDYSLIKQILSSDVNHKLKQAQNNTTNGSIPVNCIDTNNNSDRERQILKNDVDDVFTIDLTTPTDNVSKKIEVLHKTENQDRNLNELLDQVAELDQIYSDNQTRLNNMEIDNSNVQNKAMDIEDFDERHTYSSLQMAFKNPVPIVIPDLSYEDVVTQKGPIIELTPLKRDTDEKLPPLPPKRIKKAPSVEVLRPRARTVSAAEQTPKLQKSPVNSPPMLNNQIQKNTVTRSVDRLPSNLPNVPPKKRSFLSRIFSRKNKDNKSPEKLNKSVCRSASSVSGQRPSRFKQDVTHASMKGSTGNLSLGTSLRYTDSITHISLHGDDNRMSSTSLNHNNHVSLPPTDGDTILVAENVLAIDAAALKKLQDNLDLTEAEHYALYMALAPHATVSEFDELSCYYSPVEGGKLPLTTQPVVIEETDKILRRYGGVKRAKMSPESDFCRLQNLQRPMQDVLEASLDPYAHPDVNLMDISMQDQIKVEPRDQASPFGNQPQPQPHFSGMYRTAPGTPSPQPFNAPASPRDNWALNNMNYLVPPMQPLPDDTPFLDIENQLSLTELLNAEHDNITDSLTRLTTRTYEEMTGAPPNQYGKQN